MKLDWDAVELVNRTFERLSKEHSAARTSHWTDGERGLFHVVSARCQKDMGGVGTVFTDCAAVDASELVAGLRGIGETELADAWGHAFATFEHTGVLRRGKWTGVEPDARVLDELERVVGHRMWDLDTKLAALLS